MSVDLVPEWTIGDLCLTSYPFGVDADSTVDVGEPEMVVESVTSMLADGDLAQVSRYGNREYVLELYVEGPTLAELATAEASLRTELRRTGLTLTHDPGDGFSPASVYEVQTAQLTPQRNDTHESHLVRKFTLTLTCTPFARSLELTTVSALLAGTSSITVDDCSSASGWTAAESVPADSLSQSAGAVWVHDATGGNDSMALRRAASIDVSATPYFRLEWKSNPGPGFTLLGLPSSSTPFPSELSRVALADGWTRSTWRVEPGDLDSGFQFAYLNADATSHEGDYLGVREVVKSDEPPGVSARQNSRVVEVGGTERTPASLKAFTASGYLGHTLLHTTPYLGNGYTPDLQRWRVSGNGTSTNSSSRKITGTWEAMQPNSVVAEVPSDNLPRGDYILIAAVKSSATGERAVSWAVKSLLNTSVVGNTQGISYYAFEVADRLEYVPLGVVSAPVVRSEGVLKTQVHLSNPSPGTTTMHVEEWWLFKDGPDSALSIVGTDEANLIIQSPDSTSGVPEVWVGTGDALFHPNGRLLAQGTHMFPPGPMQVNTISDANDYLQVELSYYKRWHSNAAE